MATKTLKTPAVEQAAPIQVQVVETKKPSIEERFNAFLQPDSNEVVETDQEEEEDANAQERQNSSSEDAVQDKSQEDSEEDAVQDESQEEVESEEVEELEVESLADLAAQLDVDVADLYNIKVPMSYDDGKPVEVPLGEWKAHVQNMMKQEFEKVNVQHQEAERQIEATNAFLNQQVQNSHALISAMESELAGSINAVDWQELRKENPGEYAAKLQEQEARIKQLDGYKQNVAQQIDQNQSVAKQEWEAKRAEKLVTEHQLLLNAIPNWVNQEKATAEQAQVGSYLASKGFTPEEAGTIVDHRFIVMAREAMLYNQMQSATPAKKKIVKIGKKTIKPGAKQSRGQSATEAKARSRAKLKSDGSLDAAAAHFKSMFK